MKIKRATLYLGAILLCAGGAYAQQYTTTDAFNILTQSSGGYCDPQHGADNVFFKSACCSSPGNSACGVRLFGTSACTDPSINQLRWSNYDNNLRCQLPDAVPEVNPLPPGRPPTGTDFSFIVTSDLHFYRISYDVLDQVEHPTRINAEAARLALLGTPVSAVVIPGDVTTSPNEDRLAPYRLLWEHGNLPGASINLPVFFGLGNHDASALPKGFGPDTSTDAQRMWDYLDTRFSHLNLDTNPSGCLANIDLNCVGFGPYAGSHNYSWDWQGVHMVMLNTWAGDHDRRWTPPFGLDGLTWLKNDLEHFVGKSGRPVILFQHYPLNDFIDFVWSSDNQNDFVSILKPYNVIGLFAGHTHGLGMKSVANSVNQGLALGTTLDNYIDGSGGDCSNYGDGGYQCTTAVANFLVAHVTDQYLDVTARSWYRGGATYDDSGMGYSPSSGATCHKRIFHRVSDVTHSASVSIDNTAHTINVVNSSAQPLTGTIALKLAPGSGNFLYAFDFTDSCSNGSTFLLLTQNGIQPGANAQVSFQAYKGLSPADITVYQLNDSLVADDPAPRVGTNPVTIRVTHSGFDVPFTYSIAAAPTGSQWLQVSVDHTTTPAKFTLTADSLTKYPFLTTSFTIFPNDFTVGPLTIPVTLQPASVSIHSNVPNAQFGFNSQMVTAPYSNVVQPGDIVSLGAPPMQNPATGITYLFQSWNNSTDRDQRVTVPLGGVSFDLNFQTKYRITTSASPASGGNITPKTADFVAGNSITVQATPAPGFQFTNFSGDVHSTSNPMQMSASGPLTVVANFMPTGQPQIYAANGGAASDVVDPSTGQVKHIVPITLNNVSTNPAVGVQIDSIAGIRVLSGSGTVTSLMSAPIVAVDLGPGKSTGVTVPFTWPATATRVQFVVNFSANGGSYKQSTTLNLFR